jgi:hypothetical protein
MQQGAVQTAQTYGPLANHKQQVSSKQSWVQHPLKTTYAAYAAIALTDGS